MAHRQRPKRYGRDNAAIQRRLRRLALWAGWWLDLNNPRLRGQCRKTVPIRLRGVKNRRQRHWEERRFRQAVRNALAHGDPLPVYKPDWAD